MESQRFVFGGFEFASDRQELLERGRHLRLGSRALALLQILLENAGQLVTKEQLIARVWPGVWVDEANLRVHMGALRKVLGDGQSGRKYILNVPGRGYRFVETVVSGFEALHSAAAPPPPAIKEQLPQPGRLLGRMEVIDSLASQLTSRRLVSIVGPGGIGKTSIALAIAEIWSHSKPGRVIFIDLSATTDPARLWIVAGNAFGAEFSADPKTQILRFLEESPTLVILDNCEQVIDAAAEFVEAALSVSTKVRVLVTSREPLRVAEETAHRLGPLNYPETAEGLTPVAALEYSAIALFVERVIASNDQFDLSEGDIPHVIEICRRLAGNPLALELAAARTDLFTLPQLAQGLDDRFRVLTRGKRTALPRHQTLRALLEWSYRLLSQTEQLLMRRLAVFPASFDIQDATQLAVVPGSDPGNYLDGVTNLVAKSLLTVDITGETAKYRFNETTRAFALEELQRTEEADDAFRSLANYTVSTLLAVPGADGDARAAWLKGSGRCLDNVRAALDWAIGRDRDRKTGLDLVLAALPVWLQLSRLVENQTFLRIALDTLGEQPNRRHDRLALETSNGLSFYYKTGPTPEVIALLKSALAIARDISATSEELSILWMLYGISGNWGDYTAANTFASDYTKASEALPVPTVALKRHRILARAEHDLGNHHSALAHLTEALPHMSADSKGARLNAYEIDDITAALAVRARTLWIIGQVDDALEVAEECLERGVRLDHAQSLCWALTFNMCPVAIWRGDLNLANRYVTIDSTQSEKTFEHWHDWSGMYQVALEDLSTPQRPPAFPAMFSQMIPSQEDLFATFSASFASPALMARYSRAVPSWCTAELMRIDAAENKANRSVEERHRLLMSALSLAESQGARSWQLRVATQIVRLERMEGLHSDGRDLLNSVIALFKQGHHTADWKAAGQLLG